MPPILFNLPRNSYQLITNSSKYHYYRSISLSSSTLYNSEQYLERQKMVDLIPQEQQNDGDVIVTNTSKNVAEFTQRDSKVLYQLKSVFPFDPFPMTLTIEPTVIHVVDQSFFFSHAILSLSIKDLLTVELDTGIIFATLKFQQAPPIQPALEYNTFWKSQALKARRIIQGLVIVNKEGLQIPDMPIPELNQYLEKMGSTQTSHS